MAEPLPGQRAGQHPKQAAGAVQRAIRRAVTARGGPTSDLVMFVDGAWERHAVDETGREHLEPYAFDEGES
ncbi:hypothetical protein [Streptomyces alboflavus]|uniref:hypothetical protein n=1 Tax=Streptomyces alboflavus TaxID=67267 RepID=UPI0036AE6A1D